MSLLRFSKKTWVTDIATAQKMKLSVKDFLTKREKILNGKLHFFVLWDGKTRQLIGIMCLEKREDKVWYPFYLIFHFHFIWYSFVMRWTIWHHLRNLKNVKNTHGGVLLLVKLQLTKSNTPPWMFFTFFICANDTKSGKASHLISMEKFFESTLRDLKVYICNSDGRLIKAATFDKIDVLKATSSILKTKKKRKVE